MTSSPVFAGQRLCVVPSNVDGDVITLRGLCSLCDHPCDHPGRGPPLCLIRLKPQNKGGPERGATNASRGLDQTTEV